MKLSEEAWKKSESIYQALIEHPFNQELIQGTLSKEKFAYYIEQDSIYLKSFARVLAKIAALSQNTKHIKQFSKFALDSIIIGEEIVNKFSQSELDLGITGDITNATLDYTEYLIDMSTTQSIEIIVAAILPAFWIFYKVGLYVAKNSVANNPFSLWIETYSCQEFSQSVEYMIDTFDSFAEHAAEDTRQEMLNAFYKGASLEKQFLDDIVEVIKVT